MLVNLAVITTLKKPSLTHGILRSRKKEGSLTFCGRMDGTGDSYAK